MEEKVMQLIREKKLIDAGDRVLVGCSGGADSMCLLHLLAGLREELGITVCAVHVHHHLRGEDADRDAALTEDACRQLNVPCRTVHKDVLKRQQEEKLSLEEAARLCRYEAFEEAAAAFEANKLAVAHHMEDRAETMLFQMIRGSGLRGSAGMQPKRKLNAGPDCTLIRPLLAVSKEEILAYDRSHGIPWHEDRTNAETDAVRNRIRMQVMPGLFGIRPDAAEKLSGLGSYLTEVDDYLRAEARAWISIHMRHTNGEIPADPFRDTPKILQEYIVAALFRMSGIPQKDKGRVHIDRVRELADASVGKRVVLDGSWQAVRTYTGIAVRQREEADKAVPQADGLVMEMRVFPYESGMEIPQKEYTKWFDYDKIIGPLELRTRRPQDVFSQAAGAHKKLKDFLIDEKIPQEERDSLPVVADGRNVLWVVGVRMSEEYKVSGNTRTVMEIHLRREEK